MQYYKEGTPTTTLVNYKLIASSGHVIREYSGNACFSCITYSTIHKDTESILIYHEKTALPYDVEAIERWITDINSMGFPCAYIGSNNIYHNFQVNIKDYEYKAHLVSTLMLVRALFESGICCVPDNYFQIMDTNPNADKFNAVQTAHKSKMQTKYYNSNHMITFTGNGENITKEHLISGYQGTNFKVMQGSQGEPHKSIPQSPLWMG